MFKSYVKLPEAIDVNTEMANTQKQQQLMAIVAVITRVTMSAATLVVQWRVNIANRYGFMIRTAASTL